MSHTDDQSNGRTKFLGTNKNDPLLTWQSLFRFDEQQKEWIIDTVKKFGKEHIYLDKNGDWIDFEAGLIAESKAKGKIQESDS